MKKILLLIYLVTTAAIGNNLKEIRDVLKHVESNHNPTLVGDNGRSWGILQIQLIAIEDVNRKYGTNYTHEDAFDVACAEEIFELYVTMWATHLEKKHGRSATAEDIVRIWNGGPDGYRESGTIDYLKKYYKYKRKYVMNKRLCYVKNKLGRITGTYTHTYDVYLFKSKKTINVSRRHVKLIPKDSK